MVAASRKAGHGFDSDSQSILGGRYKFRTGGGLEGRFPAPTSRQPIPTLTDYLDRHAALKLGDGRARSETVDRERGKLEKIAEWRGNPRLDVIAPRHFNDLKLKLAGRAPQTVAHYLNAVSACYKAQ